MILKKEWRCKNCFTNHQPDDPEYLFWRCSKCKKLNHTLIFTAYYSLAILAGGGIILWVIIYFSIFPQKAYRKLVLTYLTNEEGGGGVISERERDDLSHKAERWRISDNEAKRIKQEVIKSLPRPKNKKPGNGPPSQVPPSDDILALLRKGDFDQARAKIENLSNGPEKANLKAMLNTKVSIETRFQYQIFGDNLSSWDLLNSQNLANLSLSHRDIYRMMITPVCDSVQVYAFQISHYHSDIEPGNDLVERLFPSPLFINGENPLSNSQSCQIPTDKRAWLSLETLPTDLNTAEESIYIIASPWPAEDIEHLYGELYRTCKFRERQELLGKFIDRLNLREKVKLPSVYFLKFSFQHGR